MLRVSYRSAAPNATLYWNRDAAVNEVRRRLGLPNGADIDPYRQSDGSYQAMVRVKLTDEDWLL